ncbi:DUF2304 domain-containing protein [Solirubrobacter sp. CPCC 204708]|uniref:DUF2304 domain-containing protein n=1 Tax=Solirubrobacter deserti TaxID=2282478 RepID=A0ABT4RNJ2_9ACTN|nr:DUF2304 domain-containing protein [Solirubrobacter deserti]MBE2317411.1 DUF2304 domain-containing protein [Solirubrobacter deserti]MDA0139993.1 DUF2304 domain-containing protein [Solirubrobacter deserti]
MDNRIQIVAIFATALQFAVVFELVRRRRLMERYALLWMLSAAIMLGLSIWRGALEELAQLIGIAYAPSALFVIAFGFVLLLLLHFSLAISRLADENKLLAQRVGLLQQRVDELNTEAAPELEPAGRRS